jgi:ribosomal protein S18 acetylase RimI-like enzyme
MGRIQVVCAEYDKYGAQKENVLIAIDENQKALGALCIYPLFAYDDEPEHPHTIYLHFRTEGSCRLTEPVKDILLERGLQRAAEIKRQAGQVQTRAYACFFEHQKDAIAYFASRGFEHDEGMYILERNSDKGLPSLEISEGIAFKRWEMETEEEQQRFIETHRKVFPQHPYSIEKIQELKTLLGWENLTGFHDGEIIGNIMVYIKDAKAGIGYIEDLFVQKAWRRKGIAKALLTMALRYFQEQDIFRVQLEMWSTNKAALGLYRAYNFEKIRETEIAVGIYV